MATIPSMITWTDHQLVTPELLNEQIRDAGNFNLKRPGATVSVANSYSQTGSSLQPTFDTVNYNSDNMVNLITLPNGLIINTPGLYLVAAKYDYKAGSSQTQRSSVWVANNSGPDCARFQAVAEIGSAAVIGSCSGVSFLAAGTHITYQFNCTNSATFTFGNQVRISLSAFWLGS